MGPRRMVYVVSALFWLLTFMGPGGVQAGEFDWQVIAQVQLSKSMDLIQFGSDGSKTRLTHNGFAGAPSLSPDGQSLFFSEAVESGEDESLIQLFRLDLKTKQVTRISDGSANDDLPACSSDGKRIAFASKPNAGGKWLLYIMDADGKNRQPVEMAGKDKNTVFPCWSPDGTKIAYFQPLLVFGSLQVADLQKKTAVSLLPFWWLFNNFPSWSPQGDRIAFADWSPLSKKATIWVAKPDGSDRRRLTDGPEDMHPSWFPDKSKIVFIRNYGAKTGICSVDLNSLEVKTLVEPVQGELYAYPKVLPQPPLPKSHAISKLND